MWRLPSASPAFIVQSVGHRTEPVIFHIGVALAAFSASCIRAALPQGLLPAGSLSLIREGRKAGCEEKSLLARGQDADLSDVLCPPVPRRPAKVAAVLPNTRCASGSRENGEAIIGKADKGEEKNFFRN
jgi:hypothetical protein